MTRRADCLKNEYYTVCHKIYLFHITLVEPFTTHSENKDDAGSEYMRIIVFSLFNHK